MNMDAICATLKKTTDGLLDGTLDLKVAAEIHNGLGKIIRIQTAAVAYCAVHSNNPLAKQLPFFEQCAKTPTAIEGSTGTPPLPEA